MGILRLGREGQRDIMDAKKEKSIESIIKEKALKKEFCSSTNHFFINLFITSNFQPYA